MSILVPVFNRADLLAECLDSALAQTMQDLEVVLVDGASTDDTWTVCRAYAARDKRIRAIREDSNSGPVGGWNRCLAEASGTYATFLWSDDLIRPEFLERTLHFMERPDVAFAFTAAEIGTSPGAGAVHYMARTGPMPSEAFIATSLSSPGVLPVSPACALFRLQDLRDALTPILPTSPPADLSSTGAGTDVLLFLRTAERYPFVASVGEALAFFRVHPGSISVHGRAGMVRLHYALARAWYASTRGSRSAVEESLARHWLSDMWVSRRPVSPWNAARQYSGLISAPSLMLAALRFGGTFVRTRGGGATR